MRTVVLAVTIALVTGACTLFFEHGTSESSVPDASVTDDGQQPVFPDASNPNIDAGIDDADHTDGGSGGSDGGCDPGVDAGYPVDAADVDASVFPDAAW